MEMDIYMRRRLVALGGLVAFFILFVLLVKSCGGDDEPAAPLATSGASGTSGVVALTPDEFIAGADDICGPANRAVGALDPTDPNETREEFRITKGELSSLESLELAEQDRQISQFLSLLGDVVSALKSKSIAIDRNDTAAADEAQVEIDTAEAEARQLGEQIGFTECGQFLDAGQSPSDAGGASQTDTTATDTGTVTPSTDTGGVTPTTPVTPTTTTPPAEDTGGITP